VLQKSSAHVVRHLDLDGIERDADRFRPTIQSAPTVNGCTAQSASASASEATIIAMRQDRSEMVAVCDR
jgi:hypothetical protein